MVPGVNALTMLSQTGKYCNADQEPYLRFDASAKMLLQFQELIVIPHAVGPLPKPFDPILEIEELKKKLAEAERKQSTAPSTKTEEKTQVPPKLMVIPAAKPQIRPNVTPSELGQKPKRASDDWRKIAEDFEKR
jgi:hypothetical protein